jgi:hypothetical protein
MTAVSDQQSVSLHVGGVRGYRGKAVGNPEAALQGIFSVFEN